MPIPSSTGPFKVGCVDIMTAASSIPVKFDPDTVCRAELGTFMRLFYPCIDSTSHYKLAKWLPEPGQWLYSCGFGKHLRAGSWFSWVLHYFTKNIVIPAYQNIPIVDQQLWQNQQNFDGFKKKADLPVIIFSHGLAGTHGTYTVWCTQLASQGFVVAAVEHRDCSASSTFIVGGKEDLIEIPYYVLPTVDDGKEEVLNMRHMQLRKRTKEISDALNVLEMLNENPENVQNCLPQTLDLNSFKGRLDTKLSWVMGHSFGGATALNALKNDQRLRCGVCLDVWFVPLEDEFYERKDTEDKPALLINTELFNWKKNLERCSRYMENSEKDFVELITLRGTEHYDQCDIPGIVPTFLHKYIRKKIEFRLSFADAVDVQRKILTDYFSKYLNRENEADPVKLIDDEYALPDVFIKGSNIEL